MREVGARKALSLEGRSALDLRLSGKQNHLKNTLPQPLQPNPSWFQSAESAKSVDKTIHIKGFAQKIEDYRLWSMDYQEFDPVHPV